MKPVLIAILLLLSMARPGAHDGHGEVSVLNGTVRSVEPDRLEIEARDQITLQLKNVWILLDGKTKLLDGRKRVDTLPLVFGDRVETVVRSEHGLGNSIRFRATQVRLNQARKQPSPAAR